MPTTLINQKRKADIVHQKLVEGPDKLQISELFCDTIQGEGLYSGVPSTFIRLQGCTLRCVFCDTLEVWPYGSEYSFEEICALFESVDLIPRLAAGQHLIWTGGSPLKQQASIIRFLEYFKQRYGFKPFCEIENEAVLSYQPELLSLIECWNNSPKLSNSQMKKNIRVKPDVLRQLSELQTSWFKFVISSPEDWKEIEEDYLPHINKSQIILMPCGQTQEELEQTRELTANLAIQHGVRFCDRLHITIWNKKTGV